MTGAIAKGPLFNGHPQTLRAFASNATLTRGDLVNITANQLELAATGERIAGILKRNTTNAGVNDQVNMTPYLTFLMDNDNTGTTFVATHANSMFFDITGATNAQVVDTSTLLASDLVASSGQLACLAYNPGSAGTTIGLYIINPAERQF